MIYNMPSRQIERQVGEQSGACWKKLGYSSPKLLENETKLKGLNIGPCQVAWKSNMSANVLFRTTLYGENMSIRIGCFQPSLA